MKKITILLIIGVFILQNKSIGQNNFYVSPTGNDANVGTNTAPFATIQKAIEAVKSVNKTAAGTTVVTINAGTYSIANPITITETAGGTSAHSVTFKAATGANVLISGGIKITGWTQTTGKPYFQKAVTQDEIRDLYVAGERRTRARTNMKITGLNWVKSGTTKVGMLIDKSILPAIARPEQLEFHMQSDWRDAYVPIQSMMESNGVWDVRSNKLNEVTGLTTIAAAPSFSRPFYIENALELLDQPGEWCFDRQSQILYYYPKSGENMTTLEVIVPICEKIIDIKGTLLTSKVQNITFEGLRFAHTSWNQPSYEGWYGYQSEHLVRPSGVVTPPAAIVVNNASNINIVNCQILNTAVSGIAFPNGVNNSRIEGCYFFDNGGAAIQISNKNLITIDVAGEEAPANDLVKNNLIVRAGAAFYGSPAISSYYTDGLTIDQNTILQVPYTGISVGFGWESLSTTCKNNKITNNKVCDYLTICRDGGGIYTLGNQPNSLVEGNYLKNAYNEWAGLYFDQGSAYYTVRNNVVETAPRWLHIWKNSIHDITLSNNWSNTYSYLNRGTNITYQDPILSTNTNWSAVAQTVINNSGFIPSQTSFTGLLPSTTNVAPTISINGGAVRTISIIDQLRLTANVSDDGKPFGVLNTLWRKKSGFGTVTFPTAEQASTLVFFSAAGTYTLECIAKDLKDSTIATVQVEVLSAPLGANLALNKTATATSSYDATTYIASKAVDGNPNTIWVSSVADANFSTWTVDLGAVVSVGRLELEARRGFDFPNTRRYLMFEGADEPTFASPILIAYQGEVAFDSEGTWSFNIVPAVKCRYIRMSHSVAGDNTIAEFRVFDVKGSITAIKENAVKSGIKTTIHPNPLKDNDLSITMKGYVSKENIDVHIFDIAGKCVYQSLHKIAAIDDLNINVNRHVFAKGVYIVNIQDKNGLFESKKLVVD